MKTRLLRYTLPIILLSLGVPAVNATELKVSFEASPAPPYGQVMAYESYVFNVTVENKGVTVAPGEPVDEAGQSMYSGRVVVSLRLTIRGRGGYDFGESTTGYTTPVLEEAEFGTVITIPVNGTRTHISLNYTFTKDAYEYDLKPYEDVEATVKAAAYYEVYNQTTGPTAPFRGPKVSEMTAVYSLMDETKIGYIQGKLKDMADEVKPLRGINRPEYVDSATYLNMLDDMNASIREGDYSTALKTYQKYDEKYRLSLISSLTKEAAKSWERAGVIADLEWRILQLETTLEQQMSRLQLELEQAQAKYATLSQTYQRKQAELKEAKQSLTTAITAVFLASIAFFFLGRRTATGKLFGQGKTDQGMNGDEAAPGVR
ncbi:MAG: hypothetical protein V1924_06440 [Candidatus Bathyarchaeota archaeon]